MTTKLKSFWDMTPSQFHTPLQAYLLGSITAEDAQAEVDKIAQTSTALCEHRDRFLRDVEDTFRVETLSPSQ